MKERRFDDSDKAKIQRLLAGGLALEIARDAIGLVGVVLVGGGAWQIWGAAGLAAPGGILVLLAILSHWRRP